jgi:FMN phosphatase YigB (HAD superfamily)
MIKSLILDQDDTLYSKKSELALVLRKKTKSWLMKRLHLSRKKIDSLYENLIQEYPNPFDGFTSLGCSVEDYHNSVFNNIAPSKYLTRDTKLIELFRNVSQNIYIYIVTFASPSYSERLQQTLGISSYIQRSFYVRNNPIDYSKKYFYELITKDEKLNFREICVVGDNYWTDIKPAVDLGCMAVYISDKKVEGDCYTIKNVYELSKLLNT